MESKDIQKSSTISKVFGNDILLSPIIVKALQDDALLNELHRQLLEILMNANPIDIQISPTEFKTIFSDEVNELTAKIRQEIAFRREQILSFYNR